MNASFWSGKRVLITGHTGFKGSWLSLWLTELGASVYGFSIDVPTKPSLYEAAEVNRCVDSVKGDVRDIDALLQCFSDAAPDVVVHMAAQSLVKESYESPINTYSTNVLGTVNVLDAIRRTPTVRAALIVTSDKCYENREQEWSYRENDPLGGRDPYSSSKACAEIVTAAYRASFFTENVNGTQLASARAGNVIGGGDWADDRLVPDVVNALNESRQPPLRNPTSTRPWQFVLDALRGYLILMERLWDRSETYAQAWNFGPPQQDAVPVATLVGKISARWGSDVDFVETASDLHEARFLGLDSGKAASQLGWAPLLQLDDTLDWVVDWYKSYFAGSNMHEHTRLQLQRFMDKAGV